MISAEEDVRLDENQRAIMGRMIEEGMDEREAKLRVLCIAKPPDHFVTVPSRGLKYPKMMYHTDGRTRIAQNPEGVQEATANGWSIDPTPKALKRLQNTAPETGEFEVPAAMTIAAQKRKAKEA